MNKLEESVHDLSVKCAEMLYRKEHGYADFCELEFASIRYDLVTALKELEKHDILKEIAKCNLWLKLGGKFYTVVNGIVMYCATNDSDRLWNSDNYSTLEAFYDDIQEGLIVPAVGEYDE
jgi:hypothetical protein